MSGTEKTKKQLMSELEQLRKRVAELEAGEIERKQAEEALRESEENWRSLTENSPDYIMLLDKEARIQFVNRTITGLQHEAMIGRSVYEFIPEESYYDAARCFRRVLETKETDYYSAEYRMSDGETRYFDVRIGPVLHDDEVVAFISNSNDVTERRWAEDALTQSEEMFNKAFHTSPNTMAITTQKEGRFIEVNENFCRLMGYDREEIIGNTALKINIWNKVEQRDELIRQVEANGQATAVDVELRKKSGEIRSVYFSMSKIVLDEEPCLISIVQDITEQKQAQIQHETILKTALDGYWLVDLEGKIIEANNSYCQMIGYTREELQGMLISDIEAVETQEDVQKRISHILKKGSDRFETRHKCKDGTTIDVEVSVNYLDIGGGQISVFVRDITERNRAMRERLETERRYRQIVETAREGIWIIDAEAKTSFVNGMMAEMLGYGVDEMTDKSFLDFMDDEWKETARGYIENRRQSVAEQHDFMFRRKDGTELWTLLSTNSIIDENGEYAGALAMAMDITERRQVEEEHQKVERLESIGTLAGGIAHDFNNILTGILGNISLAIRYMKPDKDVYERLEAAEKASLRARDLTQQLLTFATGGIPVTEAIYIDELVKEAAGFALRGSNVACRFTLPEDLQPVEADLGQISQVITNLVINSQQAMPDGGIIDIVATNIEIGEKGALPLSSGNYVEIVVKDNGVGISKANLKKIFEPYFTTKEKGSGLGLATSYSIIKKHRGHITVESRRNEGTTVRIYLPASEKPVESKEEVVEKPVYGKGKILVMDDEDIIITTLGRMLPQSGYEVEFSRDGAEAINLYTEAKDSGKQFDAVIMDLTVPGGMGGMEAVKKLLEIDPEARVIVSSGYSTDLVIADYEEHGFSGIMTKPYSVEDLRVTLDMVLQQDSESEIPDEEKAGVLGDRKVLLMDDSELIKKAVSESLPDLGYNIEFASTGNEAISLFRKALEQEQPFDVVILDLSISAGLGGEDTIKKLRKMKPEILAVVSSGYISDPVMLEPEKHGFNATLEKPFGIEDLEALLDKLLDG